MLDKLKSEKSLVKKLSTYLDYKNENIKDQRKLIEIIKKQLKLINFINKKSTKVDYNIFNELKLFISDVKKADILSRLGYLNRNQENLLIDSLKQEFKDIRELLEYLQNVFLQQNKALNEENSQNFIDLLNKEKELIYGLANLVNKEEGVQKKLINNIDLVKEIEHSSFFIRLVTGISKLIAYKKFNVIVTGQENIPQHGPVVIAPRHFHGDNDPMLFYSIVNRRVFFLCATDWMQAVQLKIYRDFVFKKLGNVPIIRPDAKKQKLDRKEIFDSFYEAGNSIGRLLMLDQAVLIFPESWPNIDSHYTPKNIDSGVIDIKPGIFYFIDYVQKKRRIRIPIIPIGTKYIEKKGQKTQINVNIGKPFYLNSNINIADPNITFNKNFMRLIRLEIDILRKAQKELREIIAILSK